MYMAASYYTVTHTQESPEGTVFRICLDPESALFRGHFPGHPILPGVCSMQIIRECAERLTGKHMGYRKVRLCRFSNVIVPGEPEAFDVRITVTPEGVLSASIAYDDVQYVHIVAEMDV